MHGFMSTNNGPVVLVLVAVVVVVVVVCRDQAYSGSTAYAALGNIYILESQLKQFVSTVHEKTQFLTWLSE